MASRTVAKRPKRAAAGAVIQSLQRGLRIMEAVAARGTGITLAEVSREIALHPSTTFHLLRTLVALGYLAQEETTRAYRLGSKVFQLAASGWTEGQLADAAGPFLAELARQLRETSHLAVHEHGRAILIGKVDGSGPLRVAERVGTPRPMHCTAIGKALLAYLPEPERRAFLARTRLTRYTSKTIVGKAALEREIRRVRTDRYAIDDEEFSPGVRCLAAPVFGGAGQLVGALGVSGPVVRLTRHRMAEFAFRVTDAARRLSRHLGSEVSTVRVTPVRRRPRGA